MTELRLGPAARDFIWATGIEDTFVPQTKPGQRGLDEYQLMGHYEHWREDLALLRDLGVKAVRWGVPWYRVEPIPGEFEWHWVDQVLEYLVKDLGITPIIDLMHYGCPFWLRREFASNDYPAAVASYAGAFARRYTGLVRWYTPLNEPLVNALMCGKRGLWPPYLRGETGYIRIMVQLAKGIRESVKVLKEVDPQAVLVHVEAVGLSRAAREDLEALAVDDARRGYLSYDLLTGRVSPGHPLFLWLVRNGASPDDLAQLAAHPIDLDVIGMNFYPQWSTKELFITPKGKVAYRNIEGAASFGKLIEDYHDRYKTPIIVTETSAFGPDPVRAAWLEASTRTIKDLRARGVPVLGYTWFPMMTMIDWRYRFGRGPVEKYRIELGLYRLADGEGSPRWNPTPLVAQFRSYVDDPEKSIGDLIQEPELAGGDRGEIASG